MTAPIVFGPGFSTYVRSVRIALAEKGVDYQLEEFDFIASGFPAGYERRHPFLKVPAFEHDGFSLYETQAILRYVDGAFDGPAMQPGSVRGRARMTQALCVADSYLYAPAIGSIVIQRAVVPMQGGTPDEQAISAAVPAARKALAAMDALIEDGEGIGGDSFTLADAHLVPIVHYLSQVPEGEMLLGEQSHLEHWWARVRTRDAVTGTEPKLG